MPLLTDQFYELINQSKTNQYIETGTYFGDGVMEVINEYNTIHSIELSNHLYNTNIERFKDNTHVKLHCGNSKHLLPDILMDIQEPVTVFLDAHFSNGKTSKGSNCSLNYLYLFINTCIF
jgi:hypothetical protein